MTTAALIRCPTCHAYVDPQARYCVSCYTVFSPKAQSNKRRDSAGGATAKGHPWAWPSLLFTAVLAVWFMGIDANDWTGQPGSYRAVTGSMKRSILRWADQAVHPAAYSSSHGDPGPSTPWLLDNADRLPCTPTEACKVVIQFPPDQSASFLVERLDPRHTRLVPVDIHGLELLSRSTVAHLILSAKNGAARSLLITRNKHGRWSIDEPIDHGRAKQEA